MSEGMQLDYSGQSVPHVYRCTICGATGCKLWRPRFISVLYCAPCAALDQKIAIDDMDDDGCFSCDDFMLGLKTDEIRAYVMAVPSPDGTGFWGRNIPDDGVSWWRKLPSLPVTA